MDILFIVLLGIIVIIQIICLYRIVGVEEYIRNNIIDILCMCDRDQRLLCEILSVYNKNQKMLSKELRNVKKNKKG